MHLQKKRGFIAFPWGLLQDDEKEKKGVGSAERFKEQGNNSTPGHLGEITFQRGKTRLSFLCSQFQANEYVLCLIRAQYSIVIVASALGTN